MVSESLKQTSYSLGVSNSFWSQTPMLHRHIFLLLHTSLGSTTQGPGPLTKEEAICPSFQVLCHQLPFLFSFLFFWWQFCHSRNWVCKSGGLKMRCTVAGHSITQYLPLSSWLVAVHCRDPATSVPQRTQSSLSFPASNIPRKENPRPSFLGIIPFSTT